MKNSVVGERKTSLEKEAKDLLKKAKALTGPSLLELRFKPDWEQAAPLLDKAALMYKVNAREAAHMPTSLTKQSIPHMHVISHSHFPTGLLAYRLQPCMIPYTAMHPPTTLFSSPPLLAAPKPASRQPRKGGGSLRARRPRAGASGLLLARRQALRGDCRVGA